MSFNKELKIDDKKSILQFLPTELKYLTINKKIEYKNKKLKTAYLIDIIHKFITKYYFSKKTHIRMSSEILRKIYGTYYNYYFNYLIENNILNLASNYFVGKFCNTFKLNEKYYNSHIIRFENDDKIVIRKWKFKYLEKELDNLNNNKIIDPWVKNQLIDDLQYIKIDYDGAKYELDRMLKCGEIKNDAYWKNVMSIESINVKSLFYVEDKYGRLHTNFTILKKIIRSNYLKIDGEDVSELDIKNSQPLFFAKFMKDCNIEKNSLYKNEYDKYFNLVKNGSLYEYIMENTGLNREQCKPFIFKVFFGKNKINNKKDNTNKIFKQLFPNIFNWICELKLKENDYKILSKELQLMESNLIFGNICYKIKKDIPGLKMFTVHDSIFFPKKMEKMVYDIFYHYVDLLF